MNLERLREGKRFFKKTKTKKFKRPLTISHRKSRIAGENGKDQRSGSLQYRLDKKE